MKLPEVKRVMRLMETVFESAEKNHVMDFEWGRESVNNETDQDRNMHPGTKGRRVATGISGKRI